jgi:maltose alpha-D-glucosyltransferase / alpha-amylase
MLDIMRFWLDMGIDGFRVDAVPYLYEREGTNCENLPETHAYLKRMRAFVDENYAPGAMLLGEANQWPEDVRPYFGDGDEFHMNFHFPADAAHVMALARADRTPILEILARTPPIPEECQWATFLRNHDELTLEMVTEEERQFMWDHYAPEPRMRLNLGIRRRLAPCWTTTGAASSWPTRCCSPCPVRPFSITATRSAWATTSGWRTATACARRCSGRRARTPAFRRSLPHGGG